MIFFRPTNRCYIIPNFTFSLILLLFYADGILLTEVNRLLRYNGYFIYSAPPAYRKDKDYPMIWDTLMNSTSRMCWKLIARKVQTAIWIKQEDQSCLLHNAEQKLVSICDSVDDSSPSWNTPLKNCIALSKASSKLPPRPQRLSEYSESLSSIGLSQALSLDMMEYDLLLCSSSCTLWMLHLHHECINVGKIEALFCALVIGQRIETAYII